MPALPSKLQTDIGVASTIPVFITALQSIGAYTVEVTNQAYPEVTVQYWTTIMDRSVIADMLERLWGRLQ
jgi:hypothetical protein